MAGFRIALPALAAVSTLVVPVGAVTPPVRAGSLSPDVPGPGPTAASSSGAANALPGGAASTLGRWRRALAADDAATLARLLGFPGRPATSGPRPAELAAIRTANGKSALMVACKVGDLALARALVVAGADPEEASATGGTPFMFAVLGGRLDVARWLAGLGVALDARGSNGWSAVTIAAAKGLDDTLAWLLRAGAPADVADVYGFTPLMRAVDNAHVSSVRRLLDAGARVDAADERGNTSLHHAVAGGRAELVALLLDRGADPSRANRDGLTPAALATAGATGTVEDGAVSPDGRPAATLPGSLLERLERTP